MQTQSDRATFWNKLMVWARAMDSTPFDYHQDQITRLHADLSEVSRRVQAIESGVTSGHQSCCVPGEQHVQTN